MMLPVINTPEIHKEYFNFIHGKRVIFVGPAPNMKGRVLGEWIDSFDVVVRTNNFPVIMNDDNYDSSDYGNKCDVLYTNMQYYHKTRPFPADVFRKFNIKWLCMKRCRDVDYRILRHDFKIRDTFRASKHINKLIRVPLMGPIIMYDISECIPAEFSVVGIDFYSSSGDDYSAYVPGYITEKIQKENERLNIGQGMGHDIKDNARYVKEMYDRGVLTMPDFIFDTMKSVLCNG